MGTGTSYVRRDGRIFGGNDFRLVPYWMTNEDWFTVTEWIAEFWATVSMMPLFLEALWRFPTYPLGGILALNAAIASAVFHAAPTKNLLKWDQLGAGTLIVWLLTFFRLDLWFYYALPLILLVLDATSRRLGRPIRGLHPVWHTIGALCMHMILSNV